MTCLFLALVASSSVTAQEKYTLKNAYPPGQYEMVLNTEMDIVSRMSDKAKMPMKQKQTQYIAIDAAERSADGTQKVVMEITRMVMEQKMSVVNMKYDTADTTAKDSPLKMLGVIVGLKLTILYDKDNVPIKFEGFKEFLEKLSADPDYPQSALEVLKGMSDESMSKLLDAARDFMPKTPVAVGETWKTESTTEMPVFGKAKMDLTNTLKEVKVENGKKIAVVLSKAVIRTDEANEMTNMPNISMTFTKMDTSSETTALVEIESGLMVKSTAEMEMEMEMKMGLGDREITQQISGKGTTTVTVTPKEER
jgi:hypothetical protein